MLLLDEARRYYPNNPLMASKQGMSDGAATDLGAYIKKESNGP
jgi:hypothetical protein